MQNFIFISETNFTLGNTGQVVRKKQTDILQTSIRKIISTTNKMTTGTGISLNFVEAFLSM